MGYATLMAHLELGSPNTKLLKVTGELAARLNARVVGIAACQPMRILYNDGYVPAEILEQDRLEIDQEMTAAEADFRAAFGAAGVWRSAITYTSLAAELATQARCADLVITGMDRKTSVFDTSRHVEIGDLVMQAGRPCLIVPIGIDGLALGHVVVGWKDTGETRRAVRDALPLLKLAGRVTVVEIAPEAELAEARARLQDVIGWMRRHGIDATPMATASSGEDAVRLDAITRERGRLAGCRGLWAQPHAGMGAGRRDQGPAAARGAGIAGVALRINPAADDANSCEIVMAFNQARLQGKAGRSADFAQRVRAFHEKRPPRPFG